MTIGLGRRRPRAALARWSAVTSGLEVRDSAELAQLPLESGIPSGRPSAGDGIGARLGHGHGHVAPARIRAQPPLACSRKLVLFRLADDGGVELAAGGRLDEWRTPIIPSSSSTRAPTTSLPPGVSAARLKAPASPWPREPALHVRGAAPVDPPSRSRREGGHVQSSASPPSHIRVASRRRQRRPGPFSPIRRGLGATGATPALRRKSFATEPSLDGRTDSASFAPVSPGRWTLGMRTSAA